jgi:hypothetical protein
MNSKTSEIRAIERRIDEHYKEHNFLKLPTSIAIQYLLIAFEYAINPQIIRKDNNAPLYSSTHALLQVNKEALMESMNWIGEIKEKEEHKIVKNLELSIYENAKEFFELGDAFHGAVSAYTMWSRGLATAQLIDDVTVRFEYNPEQTSYDMLDLRLDEKKVYTVFNEMNKNDPLIIRRANAIIEKSVKQVDGNNITYSIREIDASQMMRVVLKLITGFMSIPNDWKIFDIKIDELQRFWASLVSIGLLHLMAINYAFDNFTFKDDLLASMIIMHPFKDWCRQLSRWTKLSRDKVGEMLNCHIYSFQHKKPDIILTPFIKVSEKHIAVSPNLLITNNLSRNFIKHLAKNYKGEFDSNSAAFADDMLNKIKTSIKKGNILIKTNINLPDKKLPDIDLCLVDEQRQEIMLCECRWTIPAADPNEVAEKMDIEKEKLSQMARLKEFITTNSDNLSYFINLHNKITFKEICYVIVFENHVGSPLNLTSDIPIIDMRIFIDLINTNNSLSESHHAIKKCEYLPKKDIDFKIQEETHKIGKYKILWSSYY